MTKKTLTPKSSAAVEVVKPAVKKKQKEQLLSLVKGQLWKVDEVHLQVIEVGKTLVHYRHFKQHHRVPASIASILSVEKYLKTNKAKLIENTFISNKQRTPAKA